MLVPVIIGPAAVANPAAIASSPVQFEMVMRLADALDLPTGLWHLVPAAVAVAETHATRTPTEVADATTVGRRLPEADRQRVRTAADDWLVTARVRFEAVELNTSAVPAGLTRAEAMADPFGLVTKLIDMQALANDLLPAAGEIPLTSIEEWTYLLAYLDAVQTPRAAPPVLRALFTAAVSMIEPLVTRMIQHLLIRRDPGTYPSLSDPALGEKARDLSRNGPKQWRDQLVNQFGVTTLATTVDWDRLIALWEDRNVVVHRGAVVDARHSARSGIDAGTVLTPTTGEVQDVIDAVAAVRYAIVAAGWEHLQPGAGAYIATSHTTPHIWDSLRTNRPPLAEGLARVQQALAGDPQTAATAQVHHWLAVELRLGPDANREQLLGWDTTALPAEFDLARQILLHDDEPALTQIRDLVAAGTLTPTDLATWPLFDRLHAAGHLTDIPTTTTKNGTLTAGT
jgi:hypothetical protein